MVKNGHHLQLRKFFIINYIFCFGCKEEDIMKIHLRNQHTPNCFIDCIYFGNYYIWCHIWFYSLALLSRLLVLSYIVAQIVILITIHIKYLSFYIILYPIIPYYTLLYPIIPYYILLYPIIFITGVPPIQSHTWPSNTYTTQPQARINPIRFIISYQYYIILYFKYIFFKKTNENENYFHFFNQSDDDFDSNIWPA